MNCAMLAVYRHDVRARHSAQWLHHRASSDEALFIRKCKPLAPCECCESYGKAGKANNTVHDDISLMHDVGQIGGNVDTGQLCSNFTAGRFVGNYDNTWLPPPCLLDDNISR